MVSATLFAILAAAGLTYGWQPDSSLGAKADSLEYIVQISPDMVGSIEKVGELTSTIDPAIRGRVSKVVVRIGNGPLPRIDPASDDRFAMAIPEMNSSLNSPIAGLPTRNQGERSVMKPGFGDLDFLGDGDLRQNAESLRNNVADNVNRSTNELGRQAQQFGSDQLQRTADGARDWMNEATGAATGRDDRGSSINGLSSPSLNRVSPPPISGTNIGQATVRQSGPSTEPRTGSISRDPTYRPYGDGFGVPSTQPIRNNGSIAAGNTLTPPWQDAGRTVNDARLGSTDSAAANFGPGNEALRSNGLRTNESFGQFAGTQTPDMRSSSLTSRTSTSARLEDPRVGLTAAGQKRLIDANDRILTTSELTPALQAIGGAQIYDGQLYDRNNGIIEMSRVENALNPRFANRDLGSDLSGMYDRDPVRSATSASILNPPQSNGSNLSQSTSGRFDDRFDSTRTSSTNSRPQSYDRYLGERGSQPSDAVLRDSQLRESEAMQRLARERELARTQSFNADDARSRLRDDLYVDDRYPSDQYRNQGYDQSRPSRQFTSDRESTLSGSLVSGGRSRQMVDDYEGRPISASDIAPERRSSRSIDGSINSGTRIESPITGSAGSSTRSSPMISHSTTPLFNGLLLVSAIVNFYLFIWLRNMRLRYRQMVASNRLVETAI